MTPSAVQYIVAVPHPDIKNASPSSPVTLPYAQAVDTSSRVSKTSITDFADKILHGIVSYDPFRMIQVNTSLNKRIKSIIGEMVVSQLNINSPFDTSIKFNRDELRKNVYQSFQLLRCYFLYWTTCSLKYRGTTTPPDSNHINQLLQQNPSILSKSFLLTMRIPWKETQLWGKEISPFRPITKEGVLKLADAIIEVRTAIREKNDIKRGILYNIYMNLNSFGKYPCTILRDIFDNIYMASLTHERRAPLRNRKNLLEKFGSSIPASELKYAICTLVDYLFRRVDLIHCNHSHDRKHRNNAILILKDLCLPFEVTQKYKTHREELKEALKKLDSEDQHEIRKRDMQSSEYIENCVLQLSQEDLNAVYKKNRSQIAQVINCLQDAVYLEVDQQFTESMSIHAVKLWLDQLHFDDTCSFGTQASCCVIS